MSDSDYSVEWAMFSFSGRMNLPDFWTHFTVVAGLLLFNNILWLWGHRSFLTACMLMSILLIWPMLAVFTKRLHDRNRSGLYCLVLLGPIVSWPIADDAYRVLESILGNYKVYRYLGALLVGPGWLLFEAGFRRSIDEENSYV